MTTRNTSADNIHLFQGPALLVALLLVDSLHFVFARLMLPCVWNGKSWRRPALRPLWRGLGPWRAVGKEGEGGARERPPVDWE